MKRITNAQRRARLALRHHLAKPAVDIAGTVESLVAVHSSDPVTVFLSMWARVPGFDTVDLEQSLYDQRSQIRHWAMRRTLWVVDRELLPALISSSTHPIGVKERRRTIQILEDGGITDDGAAWLEEAIPKVLGAVRSHGEALTRQLSRDMPELADKITFTNKAGKVMGTTGAISRVVLQLGMESKLVRGRPAGTWVSGQYRWAAFEDWLGGPVDEMPSRQASAQLIERYLGAFGPATETDLRWWTGWPVRQLRNALDDVEPATVELEDGNSGYVLANDLEDVPEPDPWVAFLPSLDSTSMGWKERDWYLGEHYPVLFDRNGNAGATVWADGRMVGGWAQKRDGEVVYDLLDDVDAGVRATIEAKRGDLQEWLGEVRVTARFRSPLDQSLTV